MEDQNNPSSQPLPVSGVGSTQKKWIIIVIVVLVALYLVQSMLFSPEDMAERMIEQASNGEYDVTIEKDGTYNVTSEAGESVSVTSGGTTKIPDNWPDSVPIPSGVNVEYAAVMNGQQGEAVSTVTYTTGDSVEEVANLYKRELATNGWTIAAQIATGDGTMLTATRNDDDGASVYISTTDGKTSVTISVQTTE